MKCHRCEEDKLSKEFPFYPLTESCNHALLHCLDVSMSLPLAVYSVVKAITICRIKIYDHNIGIHQTTLSLM